MPFSHLRQPRQSGAPDWKARPTGRSLPSPLPMENRAQLSLPRVSHSPRSGCRKDAAAKPARSRSARRHSGTSSWLHLSSQVNQLLKVRTRRLAAGWEPQKAHACEPVLPLPTSLLRGGPGCRACLQVPSGGVCPLRGGRRTPNHLTPSSTLPQGCRQVLPPD